MFASLVLSLFPHVELCALLPALRQSIIHVLEVAAYLMS